MPASSFDLFTKQYSVDFWRQHTLSYDKGEFAIRRRPVLSRGRSTGVEITLEDQMQSRGVLANVLSNSRPPAGPEGLVTASGNVLTFNTAFPDLPRLAHPAALIRGAVPLIVRQLIYEYTELERGNVGDAVEINANHPPVSPIQAPQLFSDLNNYDRQARKHLRADNARLQFKYDYLEHLATAANHHIEMPRQVAQRFDMRVLMPPQKRALKDLHKTIKRSLHAAKQDLLVLENFYSRAASGALQLERASFAATTPAQRPVDGEQELALVRTQSEGSTPSTPRGEQSDYAIAPMRLPNLFGPGELLINTAYTAMRMRKLYQTTFDTIESLRTQALRPRTSELAFLDKSYTQLLVVGSAQPVDLGPMGEGRLFQRDAQRIR